MYKVLVENEYRELSLDSDEPLIGCLMMVKNEESRIRVSLESVTGIVDCFIVYDTGSTDKTVEIITNYCEEHKINLYMIQGEFVNFSVSRNISLDYADTKNVHFCLLVDSNDELVGGDKLRKFARKNMIGEYNAFLMCQQWWSGEYNKYFNTRFIRMRKNWRYKGVVHEWICDMNEPKGKPVFRMPDDIILYQDRTEDGDKSAKRFVLDKEILMLEHKNDPKDARTLFYLAQTCECLNHIEEAFYYYKLRTDLEGFQEEKFHSFLCCGKLSERLGNDWHISLEYYMKAIEHSVRAEPLIKIAQHYKKEKKWLLAFTFCNLACSLPYPSESILFVDKNAYEYHRWHILGIVGYYCGKYEEGKSACLRAMERGLNTELDRNNLQFYIKKEQEKNDKEPHLSKKQFMQKAIKELQEKNVNLPIKKMHKLALSKWKNRRKI